MTKRQKKLKISLTSDYKRAFKNNNYCELEPANNKTDWRY